MQVNLNTYNYNNCKKPSAAAFTSVVPVKVYGWIKEGENVEKLYPATKELNLAGAIRAFTRLLAKESKLLKPEEKKVFDLFCKTVPDYNPKKIPHKTTSIRTHYTFDRGYIFTGNEANIIENAGKKLGPAKKDGALYSGDVNTGEVKYLSYNYRNTLYNLINNKSSRLIGQSPKTGAFGPLEMHIFVKPFSKKLKGKEIPKFKIDNITFEREGTTEKLVTREINPTKPQVHKEKPKNTQLELFFKD